MAIVNPLFFRRDIAKFIYIYIYTEQHYISHILNHHYYHLPNLTVIIRYLFPYFLVFIEYIFSN